MVDIIISGQGQQRPTLIPENTPPQDWTIVNEWLRSKRSRHTKRAYARAITFFYEKVKPRCLAEISLTNLQDFADIVQFEFSEMATVAQTLAAIKSLFTFSHKTGYLSFNVGAALQLPQPKNKLAQRILDQTDLYKILIEAEKGSQRDYLIVLLLYASAVRCSELCSLCWQDCQKNREAGQITVQGKRDKTRSIPLPPKVWTKLLAYKPANALDQDYVFQSRQISNNGLRRISEARVWQIVHGIAKRAGIKASPHFLRHTHATWALENKVSLKLLQETLGHDSLATTGRYTHVRPDDASSMYLNL